MSRFELTLKPSPGLKVRKPNGEFLAEQGESVSMDTYWHRRKLTGDVVEVIIRTTDNAERTSDAPVPKNRNQPIKKGKS